MGGKKEWPDLGHTGRRGDWGWYADVQQLIPISDPLHTLNAKQGSNMAKRRNLQSSEITDIVNALRHKAEGARAASVLTVEEGQTLPIGLQHLSQTLVDQADRQERLADELEDADILTLTIEG